MISSSGRLDFLGVFFNMSSRGSFCNNANQGSDWISALYLLKSVLNVSSDVWWLIDGIIVRKKTTIDFGSVFKITLLWTLRPRDRNVISLCYAVYVTHHACFQVLHVVVGESGSCSPTPRIERSFLGVAFTSMFCGGYQGEANGYLMVNDVPPTHPHTHVIWCNLILVFFYVDR